MLFLDTNGLVMNRCFFHLFSFHFLFFSYSHLSSYPFAARFFFSLLISLPCICLACVRIPILSFPFFSSPSGLLCTHPISLSHPSLSFRLAFWSCLFEGRPLFPPGLRCLNNCTRSAIWDGVVVIPVALVRKRFFCCGISFGESAWFGLIFRTGQCPSTTVAIVKLLSNPQLSASAISQ